MTAPQVQVMRVPSREIGYGRMGVYIDEILKARGINVSNDIDDTPAGTVLHCSTPAHLLKYRQGQRLTILTMFESTELPEAFRESLHHFDLVMVPSAQNQEIFSHYHPNVQFVPLGFDPALWTPTERAEPTHDFRFLIGGSGPRKGLDVAFNAFLKAFPDGSWGDGPIPRLVMKSPRATPFHHQRVSQINGRLTEADEIALYASAHCYLQPSRGEGFGLQPLQAIAQGCPTILTDAHGHASFAHLGIGVSAELVATTPGSFMYGEAGSWWEPSLDEMIDRMRWVYENYTEAQVNATATAHAAQETFTWDHTVDRILGLLGDLPAYQGSGQWCYPQPKQYRIVLNRPHAASIAGYDYQWPAFEERWVPADVKRILFEGGYLDPSCVYGDTGLTQEQISRAELLSGRESTCGTCGQVLNTMPTRADRIEAELNATDPLPVR